jgi:periplasmic divalent cation tolerance protein
MSHPVIVFSTCANTNTAQLIASALVEQQLAACVSVVSAAVSTYRWEGKINVDVEALLIIKTMSHLLESAQRIVKDLSGYEVPEFVAVEITDGSASYLDWLKAQCLSKADSNHGA